MFRKSTSANTPFWMRWVLPSETTAAVSSFPRACRADDSSLISWVKLAEDWPTSGYSQSMSAPSSP